MPRAASFTPGSTSWSPRQVFRTMGSREYSVMPVMTVSLPGSSTTMMMPRRAREGMVCSRSTIRRMTGRAVLETYAQMPKGSPTAMDSRLAARTMKRC